MSNETKVIQIKKGESLKKSLMREDEFVEISINGNIKKLLNKEGDWIFLNFKDVEIIAEPGKVYGIYLNEKVSLSIVQ